MTQWDRLYASHTELRKVCDDPAAELRATLKDVAGRSKLFDSNIHHRVQSAKNRETGIGLISLGRGGREEISFEGLSLGDRVKVEVAKAYLTILASVDLKSNTLVELTLMIDAERDDGTPWTVAIHLEDNRVAEKNPHGDRKGTGAGGHAALHCHVGPTLAHQPKARVPLPPLGPGALLAWLISQVVPTPTCEPAPWGDVMARLQPQGAH